MFLSHHGTDLIHGNQFASGDLPHNFVYFSGGGTNNRTSSPPFAHLFIDFDNFRQSFIIGQFFLPAFACFSYILSSLFQEFVRTGNPAGYSTGSGDGWVS